MKILLLAALNVVLTLGFTSQAFAAATCYHLAEKHVNAPTLPADEVPWKICIESVRFNSTSNTIQVIGGADASLFKNLQVDRVAVIGSDQVAFSASGVFSVKSEPGCGRAEQFQVLIAGTAREGQTAANSLKLYVEHAATSNQCFQPAVRKLYTFEAL